MTVNLELKDLLAQIGQVPSKDGGETNEEPATLISDDSEEVGIFGTISEVMDNVKIDGNDHLIYSALGSEDGIKQLESTMITHKNNQKFVSVLEESAGFTSEELETLTTIINMSNVGVFQSDLGKEFDGKYLASQDLKRRKVGLQVSKRNLEINKKSKQLWLDENADNFHHSKLLLNEAILRDVSPIVRRDPKAFYDEYMTVQFEVDGIAKKTESIEKEIEAVNAQYLEQEEELVNLYKEKSNKAGELILQNTGKQLENISKIKEIELKKDLSAKKIDFYSFVRCECGVCTSFDIDKLPKIITGDAFGDLESRVYQDNSIKIIAGVGSDGVAFNTKFRLRQDPNRYRRIILPGISNSDTPMICSGCGKKLVPPIETIESMLDHGWLTDTNSLCASKVNAKRAQSYIGSESGILYCGKNEWSSIYNSDLFVPEKTTLAEVSEDFRKVDKVEVNKTEAIHHLSEKERLLLAKIIIRDKADISDLPLIKEDYYRSRNALKLALNKLKYTYKDINIDNIPLDDDKYESKVLTAKVRNKLRRILRVLISSEAFLDYAILNNWSTLYLNSVVKDKEDFIRETQKAVNQFSLDFVFEAIISSKLQYNGTWSIGVDNVDTPHFRFVLVYLDQLKQLVSTTTKENKMAVTTKIEQFKDAVRKYKDGEESPVREIETRIKELRDLMNPIIGNNEEDVLMKFIKTYGANLLPYPENKVSSWLKNTLNILGVDNNYEVDFPKVYEKLYGNNEQ